MKTTDNWLRPLLLLLLASCQLSIVSLFAQQTQDALYIYRNDGGFNAFFFRDIKRIDYSKVDTLGVEYSDYVVQEVYALDSVFRIPISAIDSVAFVTPETKYQADVAHTTESDMWNYVIATDSVTWLLLQPNTPSGMIPKVGDKIVTLRQTEMLPAGFVGKVASVTTTAEGIRVDCGKVNLTEIFERYVCKADAYSVSDESPSRGSEQSLKVPIHLNPMAKTLHLTASNSLSSDISIDGNAYIGISVKPTIDMRLFLSVGFDTGVNFDCTIRGEMETQLQFGFNGILTGHIDQWLVKIPPIPIAGCPLVTFNAEAGVFAEIQGSLNIGGVYSTTERFYSLVQFNSLAEGTRQATASITHVKDTLTWSDVTAKVTANLGGYLKKCIQAVNADISESGVRSEMGVRAEIEAPVNWGDCALLSIAGLAGEDLSKVLMTNQDRSRKLYNQANLATITKYRFSNVQAYTKMLSWTFTKKWEETTQWGSQLGLVPQIAKPIVHMASAKNSAVTLNMPMSRELLFPVSVGADVYDSKGMLVKKYDNIYSYLDPGSTRVQMLELPGLAETGRYKAFPRMELFGYRLYSEPTDSFSAAKAAIDIPVKSYNVASSVGHIDIPINTTFDEPLFEPSAKWVSYSWNPFDHVLTVYYESLPSGMESRKCSIRVSGCDGDGTELASATIDITQVLAVIDLSTTELKAGVEGGAYVINITSTNCKDLKATPKGSEFVHSDVSGSTVSILVDPNPSTEAREATVIVSGLLESVGVRIERYISISQDGTMTPHDYDLYNGSSIMVTMPGDENRHVIHLDLSPELGTTTLQGGYIVYKSGDTKVKGSGDNRTETSWQVDLYIDPKDDNMSVDHELVTGSVSYLLNDYYTEGSGENMKKHRYTVRSSFNVKDLPALTSALSSSAFRVDNADKDSKHTNEAVSNFSYEEELDGKPGVTYSQADLDGFKEGSVSIRLDYAEGVPVLEADLSHIEAAGNDGDCRVRTYHNEVVKQVEITTSDDWLTVEGSDYITVSWPVNTSKQDRTGYVYLTGTLADGSTITRTITVKQKYERIWDDEWNISEDQKAELPSEAVLTELRNHGMPLYLGTEPPSVNGVFEMNPLELVYSVDYENSQDAEAGEVEDATHVFNITSLTGANPKAKLLSYSIYPKYEYKSPASEFFCYYGGDGKHFTLSNITTFKDDNPLGIFTMTYVTMISGEIDGNQIKNLHYAYVDLGENGNEIVAVAIMKDGDGISGTTKWDPGIEEDDDDDWENWDSRRKAMIWRSRGRAD